MGRSEPTRLRPEPPQPGAPLQCPLAGNTLIDRSRLSSHHAAGQSVKSVSANGLSKCFQAGPVDHSTPLGMEGLRRGAGKRERM